MSLSALIVEDEHDVADVLARLLHRRRIDATILHEGKPAPAWVRAGRPPRSQRARLQSRSQTRVTCWSLCGTSTLRPRSRPHNRLSLIAATMTCYVGPFTRIREHSRSRSR